LAETPGLDIRLIRGRPVALYILYGPAYLGYKGKAVAIVPDLDDPPYGSGESPSLGVFELPEIKLPALLVLLAKGALEE